MPCTDPIRVRVGTRETPLGQVVQCGNCESCLESRTKEWALRCELEGRSHERKIFVTFTYRDSCLPFGHLSPTLAPYDLKNFWKRLRKHYSGIPIKYFACGEYGDRTYRPHYHAIIFNLDFADKKISKYSPNGPYYTSPTLDSIWGHGNCIIADATTESSAYVARYIIGKKTRAKESLYEYLGIEPEFMRCSKGIGKNWYLNNIYNVHPHSNIITKGNIKNKVPRYFLKLLQKIDEDELLGHKLNIKILSQKFNSTYSQLQNIKIIKHSQLTRLKRTL